MKCFLVFFLCLLSYCTVSARDTSDQLKKEINNQLDLLTTYPYDLSGNGTSFDPDSLNKIIADNLVRYITEIGFGNFDAKAFTNIELNLLSEKLPFFVLSFYYESGGSAGVIPTSIIIKKDGDSYKYYNMSEYEASFYQIYHLKDDFYLCFSTMPGSGACFNQGIFAFRFDDVKTPIPLFNCSSYITICNSELLFDEGLKRLSIENYEGAYGTLNFEKKNDIQIFESNDWINTDGEFNGALTTQYKDNMFVQPNNE